MERNTKKELIETNNIIYKVKRFFSNLIEKVFAPKIGYNSNEEIQVDELRDNISGMNLQVQEYQINQNKIALAYKLKNNEIDVLSLSEEETEEMIEYFDEYIENKQKELKKIKANIEKMKK